MSFSKNKISLTRNEYASNMGMFLIGTFSMTQIHVIGNIGISEFVVFIIAPFYFFSEYRHMARTGFLAFISLTFLSLAGCCLSAYCNKTPMPYFLRGFAAPYGILAFTIVMHRLMRINLDSGKYYLLGNALSMIINVFVFQYGAEVDGLAGGEYGVEAVAGIVNSPIFWIGRLKPWVMLPIAGWYLETPFIYSFLAPIAFALFCMITTISGRSAAITLVFSSFLIFLGRKKRNSMIFLKKQFFLIVVLLAVGVIGLKITYSVCAANGLLGYESQQKYLAQTRGNDSLLSILMGGRMGTFVGLFACFDKPIIGHGSWALDTNDYVESFLLKYGTQEDFVQHIKNQEYLRRSGMPDARLLPCHSHLVGFWAWYGILGLIFWLYVIWVYVRQLKDYMHIVPQWFGLFAALIPSAFWGILFSPFAGRHSTPFLVGYCLFAKAIAEGKVFLPRRMLQKID